MAIREPPMDENEKNKTKKKDQMDIKIDYDNIDVVDIMDQIKHNIASQTQKCFLRAGSCLYPSAGIASKKCSSENYATIQSPYQIPGFSSSL